MTVCPYERIGNDLDGFLSEPEFLSSFERLAAKL